MTNLKNVHCSPLQLLPRLQEVALKAEDVDNSIQAKLRSIANDLQNVIEQQLKVGIQ